MKKKKKLGKLSVSEMRNMINRKCGYDVAYDLREENPTEVADWIPTGSRWLDSMICRGRLAGIPVGKIVEIAGLESTGKSYMAAQIAANAQRKNIDVIYFDSEAAIDPTFLEAAGCVFEADSSDESLGNFLYIQAQNVEFVLETIEELLAANENRMLFIWDSLALTPAVSDIETGFNPQSSIAVKARVLSKGMTKLTNPIANANSTFLVLNQLKTNITSQPAMAMVEPYTTPGGKTMNYAYSLRIWLTSRKAKASYITDDRGYRIGSEVKATLKKSRFGTQHRQCTFKILWGGEVGICDEESWLEAVKGSASIKQAGAWYTLVHSDDTEEKFQTAGWLDKLQDEKFRTRILELIDEEIIMKFDKREGEAESFYGKLEPDED